MENRSTSGDYYLGLDDVMDGTCLLAVLFGHSVACKGGRCEIFILHKSALKNLEVPSYLVVDGVLQVLLLLAGDGVSPEATKKDPFGFSAVLLMQGDRRVLCGWI